MLPTRAASAITLLNLCLVVYISLQFGPSSAFDEYPEELCTTNLAFRNFRLILSWELKNKSIPPTHYTFNYTIMSKQEEVKVVKNCTDIKESSCDVTDEWSDVTENYVVIILVYRGDSVTSQCSGSVSYLDVRLEPPEFEIAGSTDHINVMVKFPPVTPKIFGDNLWEMPSYRSFVIEEQMEDGINKHKLKINNVVGNFTYILRDLLPKTNYCVSVYFEVSEQKATIKSPLKCTLLQPGQESGSSESATIGIITGCLIVTVFISTITILKRIGYICLKNNFPNALKFRHFLAWIVPELPPSEAVSTLEIIPSNKKKKLWNYDYGDESDSDDEEVPKARATGYTMHGLMVKLPSQASDSPDQPPEPQPEEDSGTEETYEAGAGAGAGAELELPTEAEAGPGLGPSEDPSGPGERTESVPPDSFPGGDSSYMDGPEDKVTFNVNLNSVFLRPLHGDSEDTSELLSLTEDTIILDEVLPRSESGLVMAAADRTQPPQPSLSSRDLWTEDGSSERTDTSSDSDADLGDGYIMR